MIIYNNHENHRANRHIRTETCQVFSFNLCETADKSCPKTLRGSYFLNTNTRGRDESLLVICKDFPQTIKLRQWNAIFELRACKDM